MIINYQFRIKDSTSRKKLKLLSSQVNFVWNYINDVNKQNYSQYKQGINKSFISAFDLHKLLSGSSKQLGLHSQTVQAIADIYVKCKITNKKFCLSWRSYKHSLGWIPFKASGFEWNDDKVVYQDIEYKIYKSRSFPDNAKIKAGSFNEDSQGRWFVNIQVEIRDIYTVNKDSAVGIDLGVKEALTLSDGQVFSRPNITNKYAAKLALAQQAKKKKQVSKIQDKIKNSRNDYYHKLTNQIVKQFEQIYVGNVKSNDIVKISNNKNFTKSIYDASWHKIKLFLEYKAKKLGKSFKIVNEKYTTQDCSACFKRTGPKGVEGLVIREWVCSACGANHNRDINAAKNILRIGHYTL